MRSDLDRLAGLAAIVLAAGAIATRLAPADGLPPFGWPVLWGAGFVLSLALLAGLSRGAAGAEAGRLPSRADLALAAPAHLVLLGLPWLSDALPTAGLAGLALFLLASRARRDVMEVRTDERGRGVVDLWAASLFGLVGLFAVLYVGVALEMVGGRDNDASYYFGVARWIARHGTFEEPVIWHFLAPPAELVHPAFDYWQGLTSVVLAGPMALFGRTHTVASVTMATLSACSVLAFAYLVLVARPFRGRATQLAALVAFALSPAMQAFRFDTETLVVFHLGLLGSLIALAHGRLALAAGLAFLVFLTRADGLVTCGLVWAFVLWRAADEARAGEAGRRRLLAVVATMASVLGLYVSSNLARFGTATPPGARQAPFLTSYLDLYVWDPARAPGHLLDFVLGRLELAQLGHAITRVQGTFEEIDYVLRHEVLLAALPLGLLVLLRPRADGDRLHRLALALVVVGSVAIAWLSPIVFSEGRTLHPLIPAMTLVVFASFELVPRALRHLLRARPETARVVFALTTAAVLVPTLALARPYRPLAILRSDFEAELASVDSLLGGEGVATTSPWWVIANTESPAVLLPSQGEAQMAEVLERYDVGYVLFTMDDAENWGPVAWSVWSPYRSGARDRIGRFRLVQAAQRPHFIVYRVERED